MSLENAMNAAREAAANVPATTIDQTPAVQYGTGLDDFLSGGLQVDSWVQVKDGGIRLNRDEKAYLTGFDANLDVNSIQLFVGLRAEFAGNVVEYRQSNDGGKTTTRGENFAQLANQWKASSIKGCEPYRGANMVFVTTKDITQGKTTIPAGTRLGYTTPVTGFAPFQSMLKTLAADGKVSDVGGGRLAGDEVPIKAVHEVRTNKANQDYGVLLLELAN